MNTDVEPAARDGVATDRVTEAAAEAREDEVRRGPRRRRAGSGREAYELGGSGVGPPALRVGLSEVPRRRRRRSGGRRPGRGSRRRRGDRNGDRRRRWTSRRAAAPPVRRRGWPRAGGGSACAGPFIRALSSPARGSACRAIRPSQRGGGGSRRGGHASCRSRDGAPRAGGRRGRPPPRPPRGAARAAPRPAPGRFELDERLVRGDARRRAQVRPALRQRPDLDVEAGRGERAARAGPRARPRDGCGGRFRLFTRPTRSPSQSR